MVILLLRWHWIHPTSTTCPLLASGYVMYSDYRSTSSYVLYVIRYFFYFLSHLCKIRSTQTARCCILICFYSQTFRVFFFSSDERVITSLAGHFFEGRQFLYHYNLSHHPSDEIASVQLSSYTVFLSSPVIMKRNWSSTSELSLSPSPLFFISFFFFLLYLPLSSLSHQK